MGKTHIIGVGLDLGGTYFPDFDYLLKIRLSLVRGGIFPFLE